MLFIEWDLRGLWVTLTFPGKFYIFCLLAAVASTTVFHIRTLWRLRDLQKKGVSVDAGAEKSCLAAISRGIENVRQLHLLLLLLFGIALANEVLATLRGIRYSSMSLSGVSIEVFEPCAVFAFFVFGVLTFLHVFHWFVAARLRRIFPLWWA